MWITENAIKRPVATTMAVLAIAMGGIVGLFYLPVDMMPSSQSSQVTVYVGVRGGMPSEDIEHLIAEPIEEAVSSMPGLHEILSTSRKDKCTVTLSFENSENVNRATLDVSERLARIKGKLPAEIERPIVARYNENDHPIVILSATSSVKTPEILRALIEKDLKPRLSRIPGVGNVEISGGRQRKILVEFEKAKLEMHTLSILDVIRELGANNVAMATGKMENNRDSWSLQFESDFQSLDDMRELGVAVTKEGSRIRLKDIATIRDYYLEPDSYSRINSQPAVTVYIQKESGANTIRAAREIMRIAAEYQKELPRDVGLGVSIDQSVAIRQAISDVREALTEGALLTALVLWLFLRRARQVSVILLSIPVAILATFLTMLVHGVIMQKLGNPVMFTINVMSLLGVALGIGRMVDDSIVVFEKNLHPYNERLKRGDDKFDKAAVAINATGEMALAVASSTLILIVIFVPIVFFSEDIRRQFADVAFTVIVSLLASLGVAVTIIPLLASRLPLTRAPNDRSDMFKWERSLVERWKNFKDRRKKSPPVMPSSPNVSIGDPGPQKVDSRLGISGMTNRFAKALKLDAAWARIHQPRFFSRTIRHGTVWSIRNRRTVLLGVLGSLVLSGLIYRHLPKEFLGGGGQDEFIIFVELPSGSKLDVSDKVVSAVETEINALPEVKNVIKTVSTRVEGWSSKIYVTLNKGYERTRSAQDIIGELRPKLKSIGAQYQAFIYFSEATSAKELTIDLFGKDYLQLRNLAVETAKRMQSVKGLRDVKLRYKPGQPEIRLEIDHQRMALFGLTTKDVADTIHAEMRGMRATYFNSGSDQVETVARLSEEDRRTIENVSNLSVISNGPKKFVVPVQQILSIENGVTPSEVWRRNKERVIQVSANRDQLALSTAVEKVKRALAGMHVPVGYHYEFGGDYQRLVKSEKQFMYAFIVMAALVYMVLACFFESYTQPALMLLTIPLATAGSLPVLWVTGASVNMGVYIGLLMLGGTVTSNAVILIDRLNVVRKTRSLYRASLKAGLERSRPIFMTSLCTIAAMLPLTIASGESSDLWSPLAVTVVAGIALSSVLTLFVIPAAYVVLEKDIKKN
jgi:HAE1 family hydrophobic/amphiphilic exporter-1